MVSVIAVCAVAQLIVISENKKLTDIPPQGITAIVPASCESKQITQPCTADKGVWRLDCKNNNYIIVEVINAITPVPSVSISVTYYDKNGGCLLECDTAKQCCSIKEPCDAASQCQQDNREKIKIEKDSNNKVNITFINKHKNLNIPVCDCSNGGGGAVCDISSCSLSISVISIPVMLKPPSILPLISKTLTEFTSITVIVPKSCQNEQIKQLCPADKWVWTLDCKNNNNITVEVMNQTDPFTTVVSINVTYYGEDRCVAQCGADYFVKEDCPSACPPCNNGKRKEIKIENYDNNKVKIKFNNKNYTFPVIGCSGDSVVITELNSTTSPLLDFPPGGITLTVPQSCQKWLITHPCPSDIWVWNLNCTNNTNQVNVVVMTWNNYEPDSDVTPNNVTLYSTKRLVLSLETEGGCVLESTGRCVCVNNNVKHNSTACNEHGEKIYITMQDDETVKIRFNNTDYMLDDDSSLNFNQEPISWIDALKWCKNRGASLVELTKPTAKHAVKCLLKKQPDLKNLTGVWIGLERSIIGTNADWQWISGSKAEIFPWNKSFPVNRYNNHCGQSVWNHQTEEIEYLDGHCHREFPFICQGEKPPTSNIVG